MNHALHIKIKIVSRIFFASLFLSSLFLSPISLAEGSGSFKRAGDWLVGAKVANLNPAVNSAVSIGGFVEADFDTFPLLDFRYFLGDRIALEAIAGTTKHQIGVKETALGDLNLGSIKVLPPTITLQYHFDTGTNFLPYVGAGINYTFFYDDDPGDSAGITYSDEVGFAFNVGFDYPLGERTYLNLDLKKYKLSTNVEVDAGAAGTATADVDLDPLVISIGFGWKF